MKTKHILPLILFSIAMPACEKTNFSYPVAVFDVATTPRPMYKFTLDASSSFSETEGDLLEYRWDLNGDRAGWETGWMLSPFLTTVYSFESVWVMGLQVKNSSGEITEIYHDIHPGTDSDYDFFIFTAYTDLVTDFRAIRYATIEYPEYYYSVNWAHDNIIVPDNQGVFNFPDRDDRTKYGSLMCWDSAVDLDRYYKLPTLDQWQYMIDFSGGTGLAGYNMQVEVKHGLNLTHSGINKQGVLSEFGEGGYYWTGEEVNENHAFAIKITKGKDAVEIVQLEKSNLASVRLTLENYQYKD